MTDSKCFYNDDNSDIIEIGVDEVGREPDVWTRVYISCNFT